MSARLAVCLLVVCAGCSSGPIDVQTAESVPLRLDRGDALRLAESVLGSYAGGGAVETGLLSGGGDDLTLHPQKLDPAVRASLNDTDGDGAVGWDELSVFLAASYYAGHRLPQTLGELRTEARWSASDSAWFSVDVEGSVMTHARRRIYVPVAALRAALVSQAGGDGLRYPAGTVIAGEHLDGDALLETTIKRLRPDGFWDFAVYDADGILAPATSSEPRPLRAPTQCTGCHLGRRLFEPEQSFPATPAPGADGPRRYLVPEVWRSAEATARFQEHARRADGVLGIYATLYTGRMLAQRAQGSASAEDVALLGRLGL